MPTIRRYILCFLVLLWNGPVSAEDLVDVKLMMPDLAMEIAHQAMSVCRKKGYQVAAVVVDRAANMQAVIRDVYASRFTVELAQRKANAVVLSGVSSSTLLKNRQDIRPELNHIDGIIVMEGALPIVSGGAFLGAIGVSGAPGGDIDEQCAREALVMFEERLEFAD